MFVAAAVATGVAAAAEADALAISANIQARHMPFGTILDPVFPSSTSDVVIGYTHCGDSALWTGVYMAAEAFRYKVTQSPDALDNVKSALAGLKGLADVTGNNRLARCMYYADSSYALGISSEEARNSINHNGPWLWVGNTSRDQLVGAFFGLGATFDVIDDDEVKSGIAELATRLMGFVAGHNWSPNDDISSTFILRPEELQMMLQVNRHVNPASKISGPFFVPPVDTSVSLDVQSDDSYFKFNLDFLSFYNLVRIQDNDDNRSAYQTAWNHVSSQQNALFDVIDRALNGPNDTRDAEIRSLLDLWLARQRRDFIRDLHGSVTACGDQACAPVPLLQRPPADFIWQVSPFQLSGGLYGTVEEAGLDYILPYWMARYYGVISPNSVSSSAGDTRAVATGGQASAYNLGLPSTAVTVAVTDASGATFIAPLIAATADQVNFLVPDGLTPGMANFNVTAEDATRSLTGMVQYVAPALFTKNGTGTGVADATAVVVPNGSPDAQAAPACIVGSSVWALS